MFNWSKVYSRINWLNKPVQTTPLSASNLNTVDYATNEMDNRIISLDTTKLDLSVANGMVKSFALNSATGVITVTKLDGTVATYDTKLEKIAINFKYNATTQQLEITLDDGTKQYIDMSALITQYEFQDTTTVGFTVTDGKVSAIVKDGSIAADKMQPNYLADVTTQANNASASASSAQTSATDADYDAKLSQSYSVGVSGIREGEATDNAKYYCERAEEITNADSYVMKSSINVASGVAGLDANGNLSEAVANGQKPTWTIASTLTALTSGETLTVAFGKIAKAISSLMTHIADTVVHITSTERTTWNTASADATSALSQCDTLNTNLETKANKDEILNGLTAKDGVKTWAQLQAMTTGNTVGDYYYCSDGDGTHGVGNYRWTGSNFSFGGTGDEGYNKLSEGKVDRPIEYVRINGTKSVGIINKWLTVNSTYTYAHYLKVPVVAGDIYKVTAMQHTNPNNPAIVFSGISNNSLPNLSISGTMKDIEITIPVNASFMYINGWGEYASCALKKTYIETDTYINNLSADAISEKKYDIMSIVKSNNNIYYNDGTLVTQETGYHFELSTLPNEQYKISAQGFYPTLKLYDETKSSIKVILDANIVANDYEIIIPSNVYYMVVNTVSNVDIVVKKYSNINKLTGMDSKITNLQNTVDNIKIVSSVNQSFNIENLAKGCKYEYLFHDNFTRADNVESLGSNGDIYNDLSYTVLTGSGKKFGISSNGGYSVNSSDTDERAICYTDKGVSDCIIDAKFAIDSGAIGIAFRITDSNNFFYVAQISSGLMIGKYVSGVAKSIKNLTVANIGKLSVEVNGKNIEILIDNVVAYSFTDTFNINATKHGLYFRTATTSKVNYFDIKIRSEWKYKYLDILENGKIPFNMGAENVGASYSLTYDTSKTRSSNKATRMELRKTDNYKRSELSYSRITNQQLCEEIYGFDLLLDSDYSIVDSGAESIWQFHDTPDNIDWNSPSAFVNPNFAMLLRNGRYIIYRQWASGKDYIPSNTQYEETDIGSYLDDVGKYVNWVIHVKWGYETFFEPITELYKNGNLIYSKNGLPNTVNSANGSYFKFGAYKWDYVSNPNSCNATSRTAYFDNNIVYH